MAKPPLKRCAIYTRKSSEEGLEQDFNSLHAQREACEAFIKSQQGEGWRLVPTAYDDGGLSGGNMERPGLKQLLQDIQDRHIDVIVVYKVDRLTRSLADFAKMVEVFDTNEVSFVSVTQQFNTTSAMGRLTLNILLSFAQFEREVTGERIRDKIAASKRKGMWMGGHVPIGYDLDNRKLIPNQAEAKTVRSIYQRYLELGCVRRLKLALDATGIRSKIHVTTGGKRWGGNSFSRGALHDLLRNPIYLGEIRHKDVRHPGQHEPILDRQLWDQVQARLDSSNGGPKRRGKSSPSLLAGKLFDQKGRPLAPTHAVKKGKRYRYYVSKADGDEQTWRLPAEQLETIVLSAVIDVLNDRPTIAHALRESRSSIPGALERAQHSARELATKEISLADDKILRRVELRNDGLDITLTLSPSEEDALTVTKFVPIEIRRRGVESRMVLLSGSQPPNIDTVLLRTIARARAWFDDLATGRARSCEQLAAQHGVAPQYVNALLPLAFLAPEVVEAIAAGRQPAHLSATELMDRVDLPLGWPEQGTALGLR